MYCNKGKVVLFFVILNLILRIRSSTLVSDVMETNPNLNGKILMEIGKKLKLPKLQMIGKTIETVKNEIEEKMKVIIEEKLETTICAHHPCTDWTEWSRCTPTFGQFGSKFRTRRCSINTTNCEIDSKSKTEKEFGICIWFCPDGYDLTDNGFCLKLYDKEFKTGFTQEGAKKHCQKVGGHLVNIDSGVKFADVSSFLTRFPTTYGVWIDGHRKDISSPWEYTDGSQKGFFKWHSGQPDNKTDELCLSLGIHYKTPGFHDTNCSKKLVHICEIVNTV